MSVYTQVSRQQLESFLERFDTGTLIEFSGINEGIENTNYFVTTDAGKYVLTLFEHHTADELTFFLDLMAYLAEHEVPSPHPVADQTGHYLHEMNGKPAALVQRLKGRSPEMPTITQCEHIGTALGMLHIAGQDFSGHHHNPRGYVWRKKTGNRLLTHLGPNERTLLDSELEFQTSHLADNLPTGIIHADLFRDNAMFEGDILTGIIDFYYACNDALIYDLAVTANDWCSECDGSLNHEKFTALTLAYGNKRPLLELEINAWPAIIRAAALRFWLSRLQDLHFPRAGHITHTKDPDVFKRILICRRRTSTDFSLIPS